MTVAAQVKQALATLKGTQAAEQTQAIVTNLQQRVTELENEEPQYKGF
ncbi:hypothetical protein [Brevibacillus brevis]|nr:hypothetical protein [Brevibacillus brevis]RED35702.1 hypothetical protein DES34_101361 [Brevibacillus brevis]GEC89245.1 hypothetical protein BBR01nite_15760 [Brevibacillus brevis]VEF89187.1 Uncharacterised protein [Brevibacillus brevis]